ncbi:O-antigen ligase family protein [Phenylobacterium sp.]|uniref:O-antigen ligase family protein n=1 Tax=Phenylobacterium sp. TaxID=1871053 RepID=UPI00301E438F
MALSPAAATARLGGALRRVEGWALVVGAGLTPLLAWLGPLGFAPLLGLMGLLCLGAVRAGGREWPLALILVLAVVWAVLSLAWSPHHPGRLEDNTALKLALQAPLYWAVWCAARRADPDLRRRALRVLAWGLAAYGVLLTVEALTGAALYQALRAAIGDPIRPDLAQKNVAQGAFALALLWPIAWVGGLRAGAPGWLGLPMGAGVALLAWDFGYDAVLASVGLAVATAGLVLVWPRSAPKAVGLGAAVLVVAMPVVLMVLRAAGFGAAGLPESWSQRVGYWLYALDRIAEHPWRGWGLDASRAFSPDIQLHPHNGPLQLWLELGLVGAVAGGLAWAFVFRRLVRDERSVVAAGIAGSGAVYLLFGAVSFGIWQEWWLALGALAASAAALADGEDVAATT